MIGKILHNLFDFTTPDSVGRRWQWYAIEIFAVVFCLRYVWTWGLYLDSISDVVLPLGIAKWIDISFMFTPWAGMLNAVLITILLFAGFFRLWRPAFIISLMLFHLQYVARFCLGEISHGSNFVGLTIFAMGIGALLYRDGFLRRRFSLGLLYFFIGLGYFTAGMSKLIGTGLNWPDGHHLWMWIAERGVDSASKFGTASLNGFQEVLASSRTLASIVLAFGLLAELGGILIWFRKTRYLIMPVLVAMHIGISISMSIFFEAYVYEMLILGLPWYLLIDHVVNNRLDPAPAIPR